MKIKENIFINLKYFLKNLIYLTFKCCVFLQKAAKCEISGFNLIF